MQRSDSYWPPEAPCQTTVDAFVAMYRQHGFEPCLSRDSEVGYVKVAILVEPSEGLVEHAAVQLPSGKWISKMGLQEDIMHKLEGLEGPPHYFHVARVLKCRLDNAPAGLREILARYGA